MAGEIPTGGDGTSADGTLALEDGSAAASVPSADEMKFDHLGPIVLNSDGTMSQISNWDKMTPAEQERTRKLVARRNAARRKKLLEAAGSEGGSGESVTEDGADTSTREEVSSAGGPANGEAASGDGH